MRFPSSSRSPERGTRPPFRHILTAVSVAVLAAGMAVPTAVADESPPPPETMTSAPSSTSAVPTPGPVPTTCAGPTVNSDDTITFCLSAPQATVVELNFQHMVGFSPAADAFAMSETTGGLWHLTVIPPAGANWYGYNFTVNGAHVADPLNRNIWTGTPGSFSAIGAWSMVMVPGESAEYMEQTNVAHGAVSKIDYYSPLGETQRQMTVYTPPGYNDSKEYPVLYLHHGAGGNDTDWTVNMRVNYILDNLIEQEKASPMIVVMPDTYVGTNPRTTVTEDQFINEELVKTIIPYIEDNYRTLPGAENRALAGLSAGASHSRNGLFSASTEFSYYGFFSGGSMSAEQMTDLTDNHTELITKVANAQRDGDIKEIWITEGATENPYRQSTLDFYDQNSIKYTYQPGTDIDAVYGHVWDTWRKSIFAFAPTLFTMDSPDVPEVIDVPTAPVWTDDCGVTNNGSFSGFSDADQYTWKVTDHSTLNGKVGIVVTAKDGYSFPEGARTQWTQTQDNSRCTAVITATTTSQTCSASGESVPGSLTLDQTGIGSAYVYVGEKTGTKAGDLSSLAAGKYLIIATATDGYAFDTVPDGWKPSPTKDADGNTVKVSRVVEVGATDCNR